MDITITKDGSAMLAWAGNECLFQFEHRKDEKAWYFWMPCHAYDPKVFKGRFPMDYFRDACLANYFIHKGDGLGELVIVVKGRNYIGLK